MWAVALHRHRPGLCQARRAQHPAHGVPAAAEPARHNRFCPQLLLDTRVGAEVNRRPHPVPRFPQRLLGPESVKVLRLTLPNDLPGERREQAKQKPVGKAFAMVANRSSNGHSLASECIKSNDGDEEIIKVYLKARAEGGMNHDEHVNQLKSEVRYIQEARSSLKKLREDLSSKLENRQGDKQHAQVVLEKQNGSWLYPERLRADSWEEQEEDCSGEDVEKIRQTAKRLFTKLQEAEKRHQLEKKAFERTVSQYQEEVEQTSSALRRAEKSVVEKEVQMDELQRLMAGMEKEHRSLLLKMKEGEAELARLRSVEGDKLAEQDRSAQLEKEVAMLREKIHHLDDMLKSQQRKVRQMIEQLQNSKTVIQAKDAMIQELKERVAYLEAENLEMHDRIEHLIEKQVSRGGHSSRARSKSEYVSSKRLSGPKPLPLIRVVET
ncbi:tuftelin isoform X1 [Falco rusticolus]|uniref:tuftelin isoform X1 n=1 Tax=Falco rusticolus TaxID=120794 RepID=UPI00188673C9|nr:tuftelin isoform X1 [Falco rusticolus]XP_055552738.1 tuftelin isoform X1 [Falco cherrug]